MRTLTALFTNKEVTPGLTPEQDALAVNLIGFTLVLLATSFVGGGIASIRLLF